MRLATSFTAVLFLAAALTMGNAFPNARTDDPLGVAVSPQMLLLSSDQGGEVTVHTAIPLSSVDRASVALDGIAATGTGADACGNLVAKFCEADVKAIVSPPEATLTLTGVLTSGETFSGSDTVKVNP